MSAQQDRTRWTKVAEPVVIDLRDGIDTVALFQAERARRTARARRSLG